MGLYRVPERVSTGSQTGSNWVRDWVSNGSLGGFPLFGIFLQVAYRPGFHIRNINGFLLGFFYLFSIAKTYYKNFLIGRHSPYIFLNLIKLFPPFFSTHLFTFQYLLLPSTICSSTLLFFVLLFTSPLLSILFILDLLVLYRISQWVSNGFILGYQTGYERV